MSRTMNNRNLTWFLYALGIGALLMGSAKPAQAQSYVEGVSAILSSSDATEIDTFSETFETPDLAQYYGAYVAGYLFQNGALIRQGEALESPYFNDAYGGLTAATVIGDEYEIDSYHYLVAVYFFVDSSGVAQYENPDLFFFSDNTTPDPSGFNFSPGGGQPTYTVQDIFLGVTGVAILAAPPDITSISPTFDVVGSSGQLTINGANLLDIFTQQAMWSITGSGVSLTAGAQTDSQVVLNYSIALNATTGDQSLTLSSHFGASNPATFHVGDPSPVVTSVTPNVWNAGETTNITLMGTGFGTNPLLKITGPGVTNVSVSDSSDTGGPNGSTMHASVSVDIGSTGGQATLEVTSQGYNGNGFLPGPPGGKPMADNTANINPAPLTPLIIFRGSDIAGKTKSVDPGQQVVLSVMPAKGFTIASQTWQVETNRVAAGYNVAPDASTGQVMQFDQSTLQNNSIVFFYVVPQVTTTVTITVTYSERQDPVMASTTFNLGGPKGVSVDTPTNPVSVSRASDQTGKDLGLFLNLGNLSQGLKGIQFKAMPRDPGNGAYSWVQLIKQNDSKIATDSNIQLCSPQGLTAASPALDSKYPYPPSNVSATTTSPNTTEDSPGYPLAKGPSDTSTTTLHEVANVGFDATMYLMWTPQASGCDSSRGACTIPIPLGHVHWFWKGDAVNQEGLDATTHTIKDQWAEGCGSSKPDSFVAAMTVNDYPQWTQRIEGAFTGNPTPSVCKIVN
jgi:hypothetical protein